MENVLSNSLDNVNENPNNNNIELNNIDIKKDVESQESKNNFLKNKRHSKFNKNFKTYKSLTHININSNFIFDFKQPQKYFSNLHNKNLLKLNINEYTFLNNKKNDLLKNFNNEDEKNNWIELPIELADSINKYFKISYKKSNIELFVEKKLEENKAREKISCRKLSKAYFQETGNKISKTYINNLLRNKFKLSYLKTTIKNTKINDNIGKIGSFCFIKLITKCMILGFTILFLDESSILSSNNNYRCWRGSTEDIFFKMGTKKRKNLLLVVSHNEVIHFKITNDNTNEQNFLIFMEELEEILSKKNKEKFVIVMDNLSVHKTKGIINFYKKHHLNIIFNCPYRSNFNAVELAFRIIKIKLYNNLYENIEEVALEVDKILKDKNLEKSLSKNFLDTIQEYLKFYYENNNINLNSFNI